MGRFGLRPGLLGHAARDLLASYHADAGGPVPVPLGQFGDLFRMRGGEVAGWKAGIVENETWGFAWPAMPLIPDPAHLPRPAPGLGLKGVGKGGEQCRLTMAGLYRSFPQQQGSSCGSTVRMVR